MKDSNNKIRIGVPRRMKEATVCEGDVNVAMENCDDKMTV